MVHVMCLAQSSTHTKNPANLKPSTSRYAHWHDQEQLQGLHYVCWSPVYIYMQMYACMRKELAALLHSPCNIQVSLQDSECRWKSKEGDWFLLPDGRRGAFGSKVPQGQMAADSHRWYLARGGGNKRGACLPETGSSLIITAAIFHHQASPRCGSQLIHTESPPTPATCWDFAACS